MQVLHGDCLEVLKTIERNSIDACICDPPYGLGFMGKAWDHGVPGTAYWAAAYHVLKPGGFLLAFGGTRTYHRLACAIEDAGFEIRDMVSWIYGSGFPKSLDVSKAIDKRGGNAGLTAQIGAAIKAAREARGMSAAECDRIFCGGTTNWSWFEGRPSGQRMPTPNTFAKIAAAWPELIHLAETVAEIDREVVGKSAHRSGIGNGTAGHYTVGGTIADHYAITIPATDAAREWEGWGTALKPALEPICMARKPLSEGTIAANVLRWGTGAINIDGCRVDYQSDADKASCAAGVARMANSSRNNPSATNDGWNRPFMENGGLKKRLDRKASDQVASLGRFPANVILSYPENQYALREDVTADQKAELYRWLSENV